MKPVKDLRSKAQKEANVKSEVIIRVKRIFNEKKEVFKIRVVTFNDGTVKFLRSLTVGCYEGKIIRPPYDVLPKKWVDSPGRRKPFNPMSLTLEERKEWNSNRKAKKDSRKESRKKLYTKRKVKVTLPAKEADFRNVA